MSLQYDDANRVIAYDDNAVTGLHLRFGYRPDGLRAWKQVNNSPLVYSAANRYDNSALNFDDAGDLLFRRRKGERQRV